MTYRVNTKNLLFDDLTDEEAKILEKEVTALVLRGNHCWGSMAFKAWCAALEYDERQTLLVMATSYPQRALLSLVRRQTQSKKPVNARTPKAISDDLTEAHYRNAVSHPDNPWKNNGEG